MNLRSLRRDLGRHPEGPGARETSLLTVQSTGNTATSGGNSGAGSYGQLADFKAEVLNAFVAEQGVTSVVEFGCGDGNQLCLAKYPRYLGLDVSKAAVRRCMERFKDDATKSFLWYDPACFCNRGGGLRADLAMSLDVIFHLVEDDIYFKYLNDVFQAAERFVVIYSSNFERESPAVRVRHRKFTDDVARNVPGWRLIRYIPNQFPESLGPELGSFADFFMYEKCELSSQKFENVLLSPCVSA